MPLYLIERTFADGFAADRDEIREILDANEVSGVTWLFSFLSADKRKTYCLYEATNPEAIREAARAADVPVDEIIEVDRLSPGAWGFPDAAPTFANTTG